MARSLLLLAVSTSCLSLAACGGAATTAKPDGATDGVTADAVQPTPDSAQTGGAGGRDAPTGDGGVGGTGGASGTGGAAGGGTGGLAGSGGLAGRGTGGAAGAGGATASDGSVGDSADAALDAPALDAGADAPVCPGPNPAEVACLTTKNQCVPSSCGCSQDGWICTADCRSLPMCDGGTGVDQGDPVDSQGACSVTTAILKVVSTSGLEPYCFTGCGLPVRLYQDEFAVALYDQVHPACGTCERPLAPPCRPEGVAVTTAGYSYLLSKRYTVAGKCGSEDCTAATCLAPGHYTLVFSILEKTSDEICGGTAIELSAEFDYPQTTEVTVRFSTATSCSTNSDCSTGQVCFHGTSGNTCTPATEMCTSREPNFNRCVCPGCTCSGSGAANAFWGCVV
jgi:hypothetical protein